jgi:hypothetical protein
MKVSHSPLGLVTLVPPFNYDPGAEVISGETLFMDLMVVLRFIAAGCPRQGPRAVGMLA